jgi:hypothetical protein
VLSRIDENHGAMSGRIQVKVPNELLSGRVKVMMNERQQSKTDKHYEQPFCRFK